MIPLRSIKQEGFTILELMIATVIFSLVLMMTLAGIIQITKMYFQGTTQIKTQEVARSIVDEISESIRFSKELVTLPTPIVGPKIEYDDGAGTVNLDTGYICVGTRRYTYAIDRQLKESPKATPTKEKRHVLWVDRPTGGCNDVEDLTLDLTDGKELLSENMRLTRFSVVDNGSSYTIDVSVVYGDDDLLEYTDDPVTCKSAFTGSEFCGVSNLSVTVVRRL